MEGRERLRGAVAVMYVISTSIMSHASAYCDTRIRVLQAVCVCVAGNPNARCFLPSTASLKHALHVAWVLSGPDTKWGEQVITTRY
eukprot:COSAG01_NODE_4683_length_4818_cov_2.240305_6_plen_86_part_00